LREERLKRDRVEKERERESPFHETEPESRWFFPEVSFGIILVALVDEIIRYLHWVCTS